jgi:hypothetical protein
MIENRSVGVFIATGLALLAARCSGGSPTGSSGATSVSATAFSSCMRGHGVPDFPDPDPNGRPMQVDAQQLGMSDALYQEAEHACLHLLPTGGSIEHRTHQCLLYGACPPALVQQLLTSSEGTPGACAPTACRTGPTPRSAPRAAGPSSTSAPPASTRSPRSPRGSALRIASAGVSVAAPCPAFPTREAFR